MQQDTHSEGDPNYPTTSASRRGGPLGDINSSIDDQEKKGLKVNQIPITFVRLPLLKIIVLENQEICFIDSEYPYSKL